MTAMNRRGKFLALSTLTVGLVVLVAAGIVSMDWFCEEWWIHKLQTGGMKEKTRAAERLGELQSVRAMPLLFGVVGEAPQWLLYMHRPEDWASSSIGKAYWHKSEDQTEHWVACLESLVEIAREGSRSVEPILIQALQDESPVVRAYACNLLSRRKTPSEEAVQSLKDSLQDDNSKVSQAAAEALKKIQGTQDEEQR